MADSIPARITQNIKSAIQGATIRGSIVGASQVQLERIHQTINGNYDFYEICGPWAEVETQQYRVAMTTLDYTIRGYFSINDESDTANTEITYLTRNVSSDIIKALFVDPTRGSLALNTRTDGYGYSFLETDETVEFLVYVDFSVLTRLDTTDPDLLG